MPAPWFDKECRGLKDELKTLAKNLKRFPNEVAIREKMFLVKRKLGQKKLNTRLA